VPVRDSRIFPLRRPGLAYDQRPLILSPFWETHHGRIFMWLVREEELINLKGYILVVVC